MGGELCYNMQFVRLNIICPSSNIVHYTDSEVIVGLSTVLKAKARQVTSSNYAGRLRAEGLLPAVFYGPGVDAALSLCLDYKEFKTAMTTSEGNRSLYTLDIEGQGSQAAL
ncbi:MAG: hypothetical protein LBV79_08800, partial [Candidatus Adiutrix sp.]|nr:hypothetical protein [Candidatus Adiutrix sp.]